MCEEFYSSSYTDEGHLQGEDAKNIPGESMTEEHYLDHDGNLISRKVTYTSGNSIFLRNRPPTTSRMLMLISHMIFFSLFKRLPRAGDQESDSSGIDSHA